MSDGPLIVIFVILKLWVVKFYTTKFCQCANIIFDKKNQSQGDGIKKVINKVRIYKLQQTSFFKTVLYQFKSKDKMEAQVNYLL